MSKFTTEELKSEIIKLNDYINLDENKSKPDVQLEMEIIDKYPDLYDENTWMIKKLIKREKGSIEMALHMIDAISTAEQNPELLKNIDAIVTKQIMKKK